MPVLLADPLSTPAQPLHIPNSGIPELVEHLIPEPVDPPVFETETEGEQEQETAVQVKKLTKETIDR